MINTETLKSWQFVATVLTAAAVWLTALVGNTIPNRDAFIATGVVAGFYALARGVTKFNGPVKSVLHTTEFYVVILGAVSISWGTFQGHVSPAVFTAVGSFLAFATVISHALSSPPASIRR